MLSDATGMSQGGTTVDAYLTVCADGRHWASDPASVVTTRDAAYNVAQVIDSNAPGPPVTGVRIAVGHPDFPAGTPAAGTPTAWRPTRPMVTTGRGP